MKKRLFIIFAACLLLAGCANTQVDNSSSIGPSISAQVSNTFVLGGKNLMQEAVGLYHAGDEKLVFFVNNVETNLSPEQKKLWFDVFLDIFAQKIPYEKSIPSVSPSDELAPSLIGTIEARWKRTDGTTCAIAFEYSDNYSMAYSYTMANEADYQAQEYYGIPDDRLAALENLFLDLL